MLRVWMEKESSLGVLGLGLQKSKSTESCPPPPTPTQRRTPKIFRKWLKLHARVRAAVQLQTHQRSRSSTRCTLQGGLSQLNPKTLDPKPLKPETLVPSSRQKLRKTLLVPLPTRSRRGAGPHGKGTGAPVGFGVKVRVQGLGLRAC